MAWREKSLSISTRISDLGLLLLFRFVNLYIFISENTLSLLTLHFRYDARCKWKDWGNGVVTRLEKVLCCVDFLGISISGVTGSFYYDTLILHTCSDFLTLGRQREFWLGPAFNYIDTHYSIKTATLLLSDNTGSWVEV